jgi:hypothetical protein
MAISNPSFETAGTNPGEAADWTLDSASAFLDIAAFSPMVGFENFDSGWRLSLGRKLTEEFAASQTIWASVVNNVFTAGKPIASDYITGVVAVVKTGVTPASGAITVTLTYTNQASVAGRTTTVVMPANTLPGIEFAFALQDDDTGIKSIQNLQTSIATAAVIDVLGSWLLTPLNEGSKFELESTDLDLFTAGTNNYENFETGWDSEYGVINNFEAVEREYVGFAKKLFALFDDAFTFDNDSADRSIWHNNTYYGPFAADVLALLPEDSYPYEYAQHEGQATNLITYSANFLQWTPGNSATVNANTHVAPDGTTEASTLNFIADVDSRIERDFSGTSNGDTVVVSLFAESHDTVKPFRIRVRKRDGAYSYSQEFYTSSIWKRYYITVPLLTGGTTPAIAIINNAGAHAGSMVIWGVQVEKISTAKIEYPSSHIPTKNAQVTRNADELTASFSVVPDDLLGIFGVKLIMPYSSNEYGTGSDKQTIWRYYTLTHWIECKFNPATPHKIAVAISGTTFVESDALAWERGATIGIQFNPAGGSITLSGFTSGNGTYVGTQWLSYVVSNFGHSPDYGTIVWGNDDSGNYPYWGLISQPYQINPDFFVAENFDFYWNSPKTPATITNEITFRSLVDFIDGSVATTSASAFAISTGINDRLSLKWHDGGTNDLAVAIAPGIYSVASMVAEINTKVTAAAGSGKFSASIGPNNQVRLTTLYSHGSRPRVDRCMMELLDPVSDSAWPTLGFITGAVTYRFPDGFLITSAKFNTTLDEYESFEKEWRDCESNKFEFDLADPPSDLDQAEFDVALNKFENFSGIWTLTL